MLLANWSAPKNIRALSTCRQPGYSQPPYDQLNLGLHVGDIDEHVLANRDMLVQKLSLPNQPEWLNQTHSTRCIAIDEDSTREGDASFTQNQQRVLAIMTADCLPIVICNESGTEIASIHAGWRGLLNGVIENTICKFQSPPHELMAWIGPSICGRCYEVGDEVRRAFIEHHSPSIRQFLPSSNSSIHTPKWLANLPKLAEDRLQTNGIKSVFQSNICTFEQKEKFYSYRRAAQTGRIVTLIWFQ